MLLKDTRVSYSAIHANVAKKGGASGFGLCAERRPIPRYTVITWSACAKNAARRQFVDFFLFSSRRELESDCDFHPTNPRTSLLKKNKYKKCYRHSRSASVSTPVGSAPNISSSSRLNRMDGGVCVYVHISWLCIFFHPLLRRHDI